MKRCFLLGLIFIFVVGCNQEEEYEFEPESNILALMQIGEDDFMPFVGTNKYIIVGRTYDITDTLESDKKEEARSVKVFSETDTFVFKPSVTLNWSNVTVYEDRAYLNDSTLYHLEIVTSWGDTVTAEAYMPTPFRIHTPADSDTVSISQQSYDPLVITWGWRHSCRNTELYTIYCIPDVDTSELDEISPLYSLPAFTTDTSYAFFLERMVFPWDFNMHYVLRVIAVTPEYIDYMGFLNPTGESCGNLSSGYGMFGGISEDSIRVFIVE